MPKFEVTVYCPATSKALVVVEAETAEAARALIDARIGDSDNDDLDDLTFDLESLDGVRTGGVRLVAEG